MRKNKQGYQIEFECADCGKTFMLEDMRYIYPTGDHLCPKCFKKFKSTPIAKRAKDLGLEDLLRIG